MTDIKKISNKFKRGSYVGGASDVINSGVNTMFSPLTKVLNYTDDALGHIPDLNGDGSSVQDMFRNLLNTASLPNEILRKLSQGVIGLYSGIAGHNLGTSPENASDIYKELPDAIANLASFYIPIMKGRGTAGELLNPVTRNTMMQKLSDVVPLTERKMSTMIDSDLIDNFRKNVDKNIGVTPNYANNPNPVFKGEDIPKFQSSNDAVEFARNNPQLAKELKMKIIEKDSPQMQELVNNKDIDKITQNQFYREALEHTDPYKKLPLEEVSPIKPEWKNATGDVVVGDYVKFDRAVFKGVYPHSKIAGYENIRGKIIKDSYGADKQQHTFTILLPNGDVTRIKGRNLYRNGVERLEWENEGNREIFLDEKHERGNIAREKSAKRKAGKIKYDFSDDFENTDMEY